MKTLLLALAIIAPMTGADVKKSLMDADIAFDKATAESGLDGWMSFFAEDAQLILPGGVVKGKATLRAYYTKMFSRTAFSIRWKPLEAEASKDGTLGYTMGLAEMSYRDESGAAQKRFARYITVWRKMRDGTWKVVTDLGSTTG